MTHNLLSSLLNILFGRNGLEDAHTDDVDFLQCALWAVLAVLLCILLFTPWGVLPYVIDFLLHAEIILPNGQLNF